MTCHADSCEFWTGRDCACTSELREMTAAAEHHKDVLFERGERWKARCVASDYTETTDLATAARLIKARLADPEPADLTPEEQRQHAVDIEDDRVAEAGWER